MAVEEGKDGLIAPLVLIEVALLAEIGAGGHPAVDLVTKDLDVLVNRESLFELVHIFGRLVTRGQHGERHLDAVGVGGVDHGRVDTSRGGEGAGGALGCQDDDLAAPAELENCTRDGQSGRGEGSLESWGGTVGRGREVAAYPDGAKPGDRRVFVPDGLDVAGHGLGGCGGRITAEEVAQLLLLLLGVGRETGRQGEGAESASRFTNSR